MKDDEQDDLWELMGKARQPKPSAFFVANVMRKVREESERPRGVAALVVWLRRKWFIPVTAAACALAFSLSTPTNPPVKPTEPTLDDMALAVAETSEVHLIADLDTLVAADDNSVWLEADPSSLF